MKLPFRASSGTLITLLFLIFSLATPFFFYNKSLKHIAVVMASLFLVLIIPLGFFFATILLGENISLTKSLGAVLVMIGVITPQLVTLLKKKLNIISK